MKFADDRSFADPESAARKLIEIANAAESVQDQRIPDRADQSAFLRAGSCPSEYRAGIERAIANGWLIQHESGV